MKFLVIGDSCIDRFIYGACERICPEAPVPVFKPLDETQNYGMSGNVVENVKALKYKCDIITNKNNIEKIRYIDSRSRQMIIRIDKNDIIDENNKYRHDINKLKDYDAIIISDYDKGFLTETDINDILDVKCTTFLQTKKLLGKWCLKANYIKLNQYEYKKTKHLIEKLYFDIYPGVDLKLIVTLGEKGCMYKGKEYKITKKIEIRDVSGAGDTFLAALAVKYANTNNIEESILFAQKCSTKVVQKLGVVTA